jgi:multiple sugar transport system permease protein
MKKYMPIFFLLLALWSVVPLYWQFNLSFQRRVDIFSTPAFLVPPAPTLDSYLRATGILTKSVQGDLVGLGLVGPFLQGLQNSTIVAFTVMLITLALCVPAGYAFARFSFPLKSIIFFLILFARSVPPVSSVIPYYQFYKSANLLGTLPGIIAVDLTLTVPLTTWVLSGFFGSLPVELDKQARIDGCNRLQFFRRVLIPIAAPGLAAVAILAFLDSWNELIYSLILMSSNGLWLVAPAVAAPLFGVGSDIDLYVAFSSLAMLPALLGAIILQKYMTRLRIADPLTFTAPGQ